MNDLPILSALGQPTRWRAFELLMRQGDDGMLQGEIAKGLGIERNLLSVHLKILREAGLVTAEKAGREVTYRVRPAAARHAAKSIIDLIDAAKAPA
ncbi:ArsR/SmtB family transcription factor [Sphingobium sp.]|uniref:ArsR/SmtB family transcription factor n=1 Tax=Sphingobium sp. TaxID=1912891 RepID=UPI003BB73415